MEKSLFEKINYLSQEDQNAVKKALEFATQAHEKQERFSGEEYIIHPIAVAEILADLRLDSASLCAALLHDTLEDTKITLRDLEKEFGKEIAFLVNSVSKLSTIKYHGQELEIENFRKMFLAMAKDIRVILIKLADRLHNMRTIQWVPKEKQKRIASETMEIYAPIASRLGMGYMKGELEDLSFPILHPEEYQWLKNKVKQQYEERTAYLEKIKPTIVGEFEKEKVPFLSISLRAKHYWSLYRKMKRYDMDWNKIYDLVAARIIVPTITDCYGALGVIHKLWKPMPGRIKDFIATPRPTGYQSLHTTVFAQDGVVVEFQIRTKEMHEIAEKGIAAHWLYDEFSKDKKRHSFKPHQLNWIRQLHDWQETFSHAQSEDFLSALKIDFFQDRIFVFTPKGDVIDLPENATPVDFAFQIHSDIGERCIGAKVNGKMVALSEPLKSSDVVEIITSKNKKPSSDWLTFVKTSEARRRIQQFLGVTKPLAHQKQKEIKIQFRIIVKDRVGLLKDISEVFFKNKINIISSSTGIETNKKEHALVFNVSIQQKHNVEQLIQQIKRVNSVERCEKITLDW